MFDRAPTWQDKVANWNDSMKKLHLRAVFSCEVYYIDEIKFFWRGGEGDGV